jgi:hypothetical protein
LASDVLESLNKIGDWFIIPLLHSRQIRKLHFINTSEEVFAELLFKISPCDNGVCWKRRKPGKANPERDNRNKQIFKASLPKASPH